MTGWLGASRRDGQERRPSLVSTGAGSQNGGCYTPCNSPSSNPYGAPTEAMHKARLWILAGSLLLIAQGYAEPPAGYDFLPFDQGMRIAAERNQRTFLYFGRYGCTWCDRTNKEAFSDPRVHRLYSDNYVLVYVDTEGGNRLRLPSGERITEAELGARLKVFATPTFAFLEPDFTPITKTAGVKTVSDLIDMHLYVAGGHFRELTLREFQDARDRKD